MKTRFSTYDLICSVSELQQLVGMRVNQVYDIDSKTYLIRLQSSEKKVILLLESGIRIHVTAFEWPKNMAPSGFSMKMRKHIKNKRLEKLSQVGMDRIVDLQFGSGEAAYHVILELYDKGNIIFTDYAYTILNLLRPHTEGETVRFAVREKYPVDRGKERTGAPSEEFFHDILQKAKHDESLKKVLNPQLVYGPAIIEHCLLHVGLSPGAKIKDLDVNETSSKLKEAFELAETILDEASSTNLKGYIVQKKILRPKENEDLVANEEFHPMIFEQHKTQPHIEFENFDKAVDEFFSKMESQKIDLKGVQQEKAALKKLDNVKKDHEQRITNLEKSQVEDTKKAELITRNQELVDDAIMAIRQAIATQMSWTDVDNVVKEATKSGDRVASVIKHLKLKINHITLLLSDPYDECNNDGEPLLKPSLIDIDLDLSAYANAKKYYDRKRQAATKQKKTLESQDKAFKSAEKKTKQTLKEVKTGVSISKARKVFWFEKFYWFISSENYLVIGGRDQQQNELIVKRYLKTNDIYVHAGIVGASSVVIKNPKSDPVPPKTLIEAGTMAMCYSTAWEAKVVTSAWWVNANQVSKTAPTGEYLTTGSFMIRGKKNFLPQCHLIMGFSFLFKLEDGCIEGHKDERKKRDVDNSLDAETSGVSFEDVELQVSDSDNDEGNTDDAKNLSIIEEETESTFPDTEVLVEHGKAESSVKIKISNVETGKNQSVDGLDEEYVVYLGDDTPIIIKPPDKNLKSERKINFKKASENQPAVIIDEEKQPPKQKRGQKSKLKKIKEKYKDQDDEERELRMKILQGCPQDREKKNKKKDKKETNTAVGKAQTKKVSQVKLLPSDDYVDRMKNEIAENTPIDADIEEEGEKEEASQMTATADVDMLNSLTGQPFADDELLFAIPVVAPYNSIVNYKYKVKLTPGTGKRGKSAKTALNVFLKDKTATLREKDLLKFVKDQDLARNFPGKVKISAPQLNKHK